MINERFNVKEKESLLVRAASLVIKSEKDRKKVKWQMQGFIWGFFLGVIVMFFPVVTQS